jgi:DNA-binding transcriptional MerR regulator
MSGDPPKGAGAYRTIGDVADMIGLPQHILRYWETRFPQLRPLQRAGNRRYYRPEDVALAEQINRLLNVEGYTIKGVQKLLTTGMAEAAPPPAPMVAPPAPQTAAPQNNERLVVGLTALRTRLSRALAADEIASRL